MTVEKNQTVKTSNEPTGTPGEQSNTAFLVFALVLMLLLTIAVLLPLFPNDFFPYVRIGQEIVRNGGIPTTEFMTFTQPGKPAVYLYWLPSLIFLSLYTLGGVTLVTLVSALCIGGFCTLLWLCLREIKAGALTAGFVLLITTVVGINYWATRPQLFTYPLFGLALLAILRWQRRDERLIWFLPPAALLWANLHGSFIVLFFLLVPAILFGSGNRKKLVWVTLASLAATCVNRYGFGLWGSMFSMVNSDSIRLFSVEWRLPANEGWQANIFFATLLAIPALVARIKPKIAPLYWVWFLGFGWMALSATRYGVWFLPVEALLLAMILSPFFSRHLEGRNRFQNRTMNRVLGIVLLLMPLAMLPGVRQTWWQNAPPINSETTPIAAMEWLRQHTELPGEVWSDFTFSTYLAWALPERKVFMTNRFEDFPPAQFEENHRIAEADDDWQLLLDQYSINLLMPSFKYQPDLIVAASTSDAWREVYRDDRAVIFTRVAPIAIEADK